MQRDHGHSKVLLTGIPSTKASFIHIQQVRVEMKHAGVRMTLRIGGPFRQLYYLKRQHKDS